MSKMKKVISLVLCIAMLAGTFTFLGDLIAPAASAAEGSNVKTYAELDAQYDKFVYVGIDVIEVANGELTDGYVQAGDWLEYHMTVLSDMYISTSYPHLYYTKDFFDVRVVDSTTPKGNDSYTNADYTSSVKYTDGTLMNPDHPYAAPNVATYHTITSLPAAKIASQMGFCEIDETTYSNWDLVKSNVGVTTTSWNHNFPMTEDTWWTMWYVRVKTGLTDGKIGESGSRESFYKHNINPKTGKGDTTRIADIYTADVEGKSGTSVSLSTRYNVVQHVLLDDTYHTFTIGEGKPVEKKAVTFQKVDGTVIATGEYAEGDTVKVPAVDGLLTWTEATKAVELGESFTMGQKALTYVAVLNTDEFNVTINLNGGEFAEDAALPEGATVENGKLIVKAGFGEEVDLTAIPLPERAGYTGAWEPATVKVESTRGANANIKWTVETYKATFYLDEAAYENGEAAVREVTFVYGNKVPFANVTVSKADKKFDGWINAATGEKTNEETLFADNVVFYAAWTNFNATATIWGRDYENGGWKEIGTKYGDAGSTVKINDIKALVTEEALGIENIEYAVAGSESTFSEATAIRKDVTLVKGNQDIYVFTRVKFAVTLETPVFDEEGFITEEYAEEAKEFKSDSASEALTATAYVPAPEASYAGYKFVCWTDAEGNEYPAGNIALDAANGVEYTFTAKYEEVVYTIEFAVDNTSAIKEIIKVEGEFTVGDAVTLSEMNYIKEDGSEGVLPEIGKENQEQAGGPYRGVDGYKFAGWKVGVRADQLVDYDITKEVVLTPAVIKASTLNETIQIKGYWEALYYDFVAYYAKTIGEDGKPIYEAMPAVPVQTGASLAQAYAAALETVNANLPEGKKFSIWRLEGGASRPTEMPAYGVEVYASYIGRSLSIYLDYNYGTEEVPVDLETSMDKSTLYSAFLFDGVDVENDVPEGELAPIAQMIRMSGVSEANSPGTNYEVVGWKIYHVEDEADVYDKTKWHEGINDKGSTIAMHTLIFQVEWMAHSDFFFRVYNTDGALRSALDKNFQKHFWYMNKPTDKENAMPLNALPERLIIIGFLPKFEFDSGFAIRIDPLTISKAWLNPGNWGALIKALIGGLSSGFGGAI